MNTLLEMLKEFQSVILLNKLKGKRKQKEFIFVRHRNTWRRTEDFMLGYGKDKEVFYHFQIQTYTLTFLLDFLEKE